jgi:hypothetical protein
LKALLSSLAYFFTGSLIWGSLAFWSPCIFWLLIPCQMYSWQIFSHSMGRIVNLVTTTSVVQKLSKFM